MQVILSQETQDLLRLIQKETGQDENSVILNALANYIEDLKDYKSALKAEKRLKNSSFVSVDELAQAVH